MRIHVKTLDGEYIFGALIIGKLTPTELTHITGLPVFKMADGKFVTCSPEMLKRINERLEINGV
jgi:hypothetical protein